MIIDGCARVSPTPYGSIQTYEEQMRQTGIDEAAICVGGMLDVRRMNAFITGKAKPDTIPKNEYTVQALQGNPKLHGLASVDPCDPRAAELTEDYFRRGFCGLLVSPLVHKFTFADSQLEILAKICGEHGVPIYSHVAWRPGANTVEFAELARRFPKTNFVLQHMGAAPVDHEASEAAAELDNLFLETSLGNYLHILETVKTAGCGKLIFGSEYPLSHPAVELKKILLLPISELDRNRLLSGNIRNLLRL
jgi:predicted TIM-barrel fold metal-dependent hydrolase